MVIGNGGKWIWGEMDMGEMDMGVMDMGEMDLGGNGYAILHGKGSKFRPNLIFFQL